MKKRIISIVLIFFAIGFVATAQPPKPPIGNNIDTRNASKGILGGKTGTVSVREKAVKTTPTTQQNQGHVGTATALLLTLGACAVGYKIRKNKKNKTRIELRKIKSCFNKHLFKETIQFK